MNLSSDLSLGTVLYYSGGTGGGTGGYGDNQSAFYNYKKEDQIDFDRIVQENIDNGNGGALAAMRASRNDHSWMGLLSNLQYTLNDQWDLSGGIDLRRYVGKHFREMTDLMGAEFIYDDADIARDH